MENRDCIEEVYIFILDKVLCVDVSVDFYFIERFNVLKLLLML